MELGLFIVEIISSMGGTGECFTGAPEFESQCAQGGLGFFIYVDEHGGWGLCCCELCGNYGWGIVDVDVVRTNVL